MTGGPAPWQWLLLGMVDVVALVWLVGAAVETVRRRQKRGARAPAGTMGTAEGAPAAPRSSGHMAVAAVGALTALAGLAITALVTAIPGIVDSGFLGWIESALPLRLILHLPLAVAILSVGLAVLTVIGWRSRWWSRSTELRYGALAIAAVALVGQLAMWRLIGWGLT